MRFAIRHAADGFPGLPSSSTHQATAHGGGVAGRGRKRRTLSGAMLLLAMSLAVAGCAGANGVGFGDSTPLSSSGQTTPAATCPSCGTPGCTS